MKYKFKVGDKVKMTLDSHKHGMNKSVGLNQVMLVVKVSDWFCAAAYELTTESGDSTGLWLEAEIESFEEEEVNMTREYKVGDKVHVWGIPSIDIFNYFKPGTVFTVTRVNFKDSYSIDDGTGFYYYARNFSPALVEKVVKPSKIITITKWCLVSKSAPEIMDYQLFRTRQQARNDKKYDVLGDKVKVVKVKITYEV